MFWYSHKLKATHVEARLHHPGRDSADRIGDACFVAGFVQSGILPAAGGSIARGPFPGLPILVLLVMLSLGFVHCHLVVVHGAVTEEQ